MAGLPIRTTTIGQQAGQLTPIRDKRNGADPRQNGLPLALRELGRLERSLFTLKYLKDVELRRRIHLGLNRGEARNALARAVFFNRLGGLFDRTYENQRHRAGGLNLVVAATVLWNMVYMEDAVKASRERGQSISDEMLAQLSPLGWEHSNLTGDYVRKPGGGTKKCPSRQLRLPFSADEPKPWRAIFTVPRRAPYRAVVPGPDRGDGYACGSPRAPISREQDVAMARAIAGRRHRRGAGKSSSGVIRDIPAARYC